MTADLRHMSQPSQDQPSLAKISRTSQLTLDMGAITNGCFQPLGLWVVCPLLVISLHCVSAATLLQSLLQSLLPRATTSLKWMTYLPTLRPRPLGPPAPPPSYFHCTCPLISTKPPTFSSPLSFPNLPFQAFLSSQFHRGPMVYPIIHALPVALVPLSLVFPSHP